MRPAPPAEYLKSRVYRLCMKHAIFFLRPIIAARGDLAMYEMRVKGAFKGPRDHIHARADQLICACFGGAFARGFLRFKV